jgi:hypothetical protein
MRYYLKFMIKTEKSCDALKYKNHLQKSRDSKNCFISLWFIQHRNDIYLRSFSNSFIHSIQDYLNGFEMKNSEISLYCE